MATRLYNVLQFAAVAPGAVVVLPHLLNFNGLAVIPDEVKQDNADFAITAVDDTNVTVQNTGGAVASCNVKTDALHTLLRAFGASGVTALAVQPFIPSGGGASGANGAPVTSFVFRPGGVTAGNVFATWAELMTALDTVQGSKEILFDDSIVTPIVIPAGGPYGMLDTTWTALLRGGGSGAQIPVNVAAGATFTDLRSFRGNMIVDNLGAPTPVADLSDGSLVEIRDSAAVQSTGGTPFFSMPAAGLIIFFIEDVGTLGDFGAGPVLDASVAGAFVVLSLGSQGEVRPTALTIGGAATVLIIYRDASSFIDNTQAGIAGTIIQTVITVPRHRVLPVVTAVTLLFPGDLRQVDPSGGAFPVTLPAITIFNQGQPITVTNVTADATAVTVTPTGADTVNGGATDVLAAANASGTYVSDGVSNWMKVNAVP